MRTRVVLPLLLIVGCKASSTPPPASPEPAAPATPETTSAPDAAVAGPVLSESGLDTSAEAVGPIHQGMSADAVVAALGEPDAKPGYVLMEATGEYVSDWPWPSKDLTLTMAATDEAGANLSVSGITCGKNCGFALPWGLKIGSTRAEVEAIYGEHFDQGATDEHSFVAGSVYGGSFYAFEGGTVVGIFIGAGAE